MNTIASEIPFERVVSVYSGKAHTCCCGCAGKHTYASSYRDEASKRRGYSVEDHEINDAVVKRLYHRIVNDPSAVVDPDYGFVSVEADTRLNIVYFNK